jgi:D-beta-D-heptose 7-phosphate kinase/D-beta-D-heptose 1-phosphate adenosyltransferase
MSGTPHVVVVGDVILDRDVGGSVTRVCPDAPAPVLDVAGTDERPGGAGLAALLLHRSGARVTLASCFGADPAGERVRSLLAGVSLVTLAGLPATRTVTRVRSGLTTLVRLDTPAAPTPALDAGGLAAALRSADAVLVADYGRGVVADPGVRAAVSAAAAAGVPVVWDPHPRGPEPVEGTTVATPNRSEVERVVGAGDGALDVAAESLRDRWGLPALAATDGERGVVVATAGGAPLFVPAPAAVPGDTCGAGDCFAGSVALSLAAGGSPATAVGTAVRDVAAWLTAGGVASVHELHDRRMSVDPVAPHHLPERVDHANPSRRGTVVATGGCFDVLHAGHVASLEAARRLGDRLVVLLNSDASVRRLKGPGRPVNGVADRRRVLEGLSCVDEVVVFDEDDPRDALSRLRPDVWAKGGDYDLTRLPEAELLPAWGGRVVLLPHLPDRSTTRILDHARRTHVPEPLEATS